MKYNYKYRDENGNPAPTYVVVDGCQVHNPNAATYAAAGYYPYTPPTPTPEEVAERERLAEIDALKMQLQETDYKALKYIEGWISAEDYAPIKAQRQALRDRINELENVDNY